MTDIILENLRKIAWFSKLDESDQEAIREAIVEIETLRSNVSKQSLRTVLQEIRFRAELRQRDKEALREEEKKPSTREVNTS